MPIFPKDSIIICFYFFMLSEMYLKSELVLLHFSLTDIETPEFL